MDSPNLILSRASRLPMREQNLESIRNILRYTYSQIASISGYNFEPQALRRSSDLLSASELGFDGRGLAAILNRLETESKVYQFRTSRPVVLDGRAILAKLQDLCSDVLPFLSQIKTSEAMDTATADLQVVENQQIDTPRFFTAKHLSDGSLKFLAAALAILMPMHSLVFIEELENYLNPRAIRRLIFLMRDIAEQRGAQFLLTTHSETILNQMQPDEILVSRRTSDGDTKYTTFDSVERISDSLDQSGMSLGTFWGKGGLDAF